MEARRGRRERHALKFARLPLSSPSTFVFPHFSLVSVSLLPILPQFLFFRFIIANFLLFSSYRLISSNLLRNASGFLFYRGCDIFLFFPLSFSFFIFPVRNAMIMIRIFDEIWLNLNKVSTKQNSEFSLPTLSPSLENYLENYRRKIWIFSLFSCSEWILKLKLR